MNEELNKEILEKLEKIEQNKDKENRHLDADFVLVELIRKLGYLEVAEKFTKMSRDFWYS
jgi:hypothetical protein